MSPQPRLPRMFFQRNTVTVARELLGKRLVRIEHGKRLAGYIVETEAYRGEEDMGCHARAGLTPRTRVMYGPSGHAYVYFTYGMHWMLNFVVEQEGFPAAVLLRGIQPCEGVEIIAERRKGQPSKRWTDGPAKICQAFNITGEMNGIDLCAEEAEIFIENSFPHEMIHAKHVSVGPRVGLFTVPEPWKSIPWRFMLDEKIIESE
ncbi:MAG: DNA-3-methyladenine glycosylase [Anaerolineales bacterium]|nr:DNA-3-methyladenine glycosylase [Anaerolineales bacterium]